MEKNTLFTQKGPFLVLFAILLPSPNKSSCFQGCLFGGFTSDFIELCTECRKNIDIDLKKQIIAIWHDESHMNKYFSLNPPMHFHPGYSYPESLNLPYEKIIFQLDKDLLGGKTYLRT
jgi:hypothetical protein